MVVWYWFMMVWYLLVVGCSWVGDFFLILHFWSRHFLDIVWEFWVVICCWVRIVGHCWWLSYSWLLATIHLVEINNCPRAPDLPLICGKFFSSSLAASRARLWHQNMTLSQLVLTLPRLVLPIRRVNQLVHWNIYVYVYAYSARIYTDNKCNGSIQKSM